MSTVLRLPPATFFSTGFLEHLPKSAACHPLGGGGAFVRGDRSGLDAVGFIAEDGETKYAQYVEGQAKGAWGDEMAGPGYSPSVSLRHQQRSMPRISSVLNCIQRCF